MLSNTYTKICIKTFEKMSKGIFILFINYSDLDGEHIKIFFKFMKNIFQNYPKLIFQNPQISEKIFELGIASVDHFGMKMINYSHFLQKN